MHKNDEEPRTFFGKTYVYVEDEAGNLTLFSLDRMQEQVTAVVERMRATTRDWAWSYRG